MAAEFRTLLGLIILEETKGIYVYLKEEYVIVTVLFSISIFFIMNMTELQTKKWTIVFRAQTSAGRVWAVDADQT